MATNLFLMTDEELIYELEKVIRIYAMPEDRYHIDFTYNEPNTGYYEIRDEILERMSKGYEHV